MRPLSFVILLFHALPSDNPQSRMAVIKPAPDFTLATQNGDSFRLTDSNGKVRLVSFIFTTCSGTCPATTHRMAQLQEQLKTSGAQNDVHLISITLDPKRDTQEALRHYMRLYDVDSTRWTFLTGQKQNVENVIAAWGMWAKPVANEQLDHPSRIFLIDRRGRIREIYDLNFFRAAWVIDDIKALLNER